jgi:hypothetical protein
MRRFALILAASLLLMSCGPEVPEDMSYDEPDACLSEALDKLDAAVTAYRQATSKEKHEAGGAADQLAEAAEDVLACQEESQ